MQFKTTLAGKEYELKPSFKAYCAIERNAGKKYSVIVMDILNGKFGIEESAHILHGAINAGKIPEIISMDDVGEAMLKEGFTKFGPVITSYLSFAVKATEEEEKEKSQKKSK